MKKSPLITITFAQIGKLDRAKAFNTLFLANQIQSAFKFELIKDQFPLHKKYILPNKGYNIDDATDTIVQKKSLPRPLLFITSNAYGDKHNKYEKDCFWFCGFESETYPDVGILSTYLWDNLPGKRTLQPYLLMMLACYIVTEIGGLTFHDDSSRGCLLDYCDNPEDTDLWFERGTLCPECEAELQKRLESKQIIATKIIMNRALGKKCCFISTPPGKDFNPVTNEISKELGKSGWIIRKEENIPISRNTKDLLLQELSICNLLIADTTVLDPNIMYEIGLAYGWNKDIIICSQTKSIPFDISKIRTLQYKNSNKGIKLLGPRILKFTGNGKL